MLLRRLAAMAELGLLDRVLVPPPGDQPVDLLAGGRRGGRPGPSLVPGCHGEHRARRAEKSEAPGPPPRSTRPRGGPPLFAAVGPGPSRTDPGTRGVLGRALPGSGRAGGLRPGDRKTLRRPGLRPVPAAPESRVATRPTVEGAVPPSSPRPRVPGCGHASRGTPPDVDSRSQRLDLMTRIDHIGPEQSRLNRCCRVVPLGPRRRPACPGPKTAPVDPDPCERAASPSPVVDDRTIARLSPPRPTAMRPTRLATVRPGFLGASGRLAARRRSGRGDSR